MPLRRKLQSLTLTKQKNYEKSILNQKVARTRRQRGYQWEDTIVKRFNSAENWKAFRLGSPSIALPDVLAVNTENSTIFTIEAKSGTSTSLPVPADQIERCLEWIKTFDIYKKRKVLLAFKFLSKKRIGVGEYENRELREYFKIWDESLAITDCVCTYEGKFFTKIEGVRKEIFLKECKMPFKTKQRTSA
ncbi:resolvase [Candidatus Nitrosopumilus sediminis]|uniref:Resolvase, Holliday junction-type n=1 Tax=Candidatus Nitrosopumilus sediminis TaxID=1229909 RepID=K0BC82_9ARCH|nr:resolvase [Candidatus Nitrosopumilus sediminis]AFS82727.1 resolvase, Holliday junction-type [Candidatus Nitrosopumilus sediminis]